MSTDVAGCTECSLNTRRFYLELNSDVLLASEGQVVVSDSTEDMFQYFSRIADSMLNTLL